MIQEALFNAPAPITKQAANIPPKTPKHVALAEPLGQCIKCNKDAELRSPSGTLYCVKCGHCNRNVYGVMKGTVVVYEQCRTSVEKFVMHPRLGIYVCPCVLRVEKELEEKKGDK